MHNVSYRIKELRNEKGWTQQELSEISNVSRALIAGLESGAITETSTASLKKLAKAFDIEVSDIFFYL
ncbi:helix-turn-helix transcriptional regulator [Aerococcus mictus]|uniref:helix-turn-helix transcriptional regulator n=1 Tax=Aerococcus mictus TaxID=2976810 RepID=UPI002279B2A5|nr:helix-turn-helix transcriptional regulator [Aerococcus mictus]MCY3089332.1 helix-turn-helix transcriptional regulator [Aerococcus mictus]